MGDLIWCEWGRLLALASATYMTWASFWAFLFPKFFWDFVGGTLGPAGIIPGENTKAFVAIVVQIPLLQVFTLVIALMTLALEMPLPQLKGSAIHRSLGFRAVLYFIAAFVGIMVYQTVDCAVYYFITSLVYVKAITKHESIETHEHKANASEA